MHPAEQEQADTVAIFRMVRSIVEQSLFVNDLCCAKPACEINLSPLSYSMVSCPTTHLRSICKHC